MTTQSDRLAAGGRMTETGLSLGTPHYMSPEQATTEKEITPRSDVYSLASVLYEMLTGNPPHTGASAQQIIMKIIAEPAQIVTQLRKSVPTNVAAAAVALIASALAVCGGGNAPAPRAPHCNRCSSPSADFNRAAIREIHVTQRALRGLRFTDGPAPTRKP